MFRVLMVVPVAVERLPVAEVIPQEAEAHRKETMVALVEQEAPFFLLVAVVVLVPLDKQVNRKLVEMVEMALHHLSQAHL
jgi:hypothetical protein